MANISLLMCARSQHFEAEANFFKFTYIIFLQTSLQFFSKDPIINKVIFIQTMVRHQTSLDLDGIIYYRKSRPGYSYAKSVRQATVCNIEYMFLITMVKFICRW